MAKVFILGPLKNHGLELITKLIICFRKIIFYIKFYENYSREKKVIQSYKTRTDYQAKSDILDCKTLHQFTYLCPFVPLLYSRCFHIPVLALASQCNTHVRYGRSLTFFKEFMVYSLYSFRFIPELESICSLIQAGPI